MYAETEASIFGQLVKHRREALNLTQAALAGQLGYAPDTLRHVEAGRQRPSRRLATQLAAALAIPSAAHPDFIRLARGGREAPTTLGSRSLSLGTLPPPTRVLPTFLTPFRGRQTELAQITHLIRQAHRLVTLTGFGGIGKTRLAVAAAALLHDHFPHGVIFVDLAPLYDPALIVPAIAAALGYPELARTGVASLGAYLRDKQLLCVLDNCEQIPRAGPIVKRLVAQAPRLAVLVTSRTTLRLDDEQVVQVGALPLPGPDVVRPEELASYAGVQLFVERAREMQIDFDLTAANAGMVGALCRKLEGIPLALELAAAWLRVLPLAALLPRLEQQLALLGAPDAYRPQHQAGLRATLEWSYALLSAEEQWVFARVGMFGGSWTVERAEALLGRLVRQSVRTLLASNLISPAAGRGSAGRYRMLEVVREYAQQQLAAAGAADFRRTYAGYYRDWVHSLSPQLRGPQASAGLDELEEEHDNLREVLSGLLELGEREAAAQLSSDLLAFWTERDHLAEGRQWLRVVLAAGPGATATWGRALTVAGYLAAAQGDYVASQEHLEASLAILRATDDGAETARTLRLLGVNVGDRGYYAQATAYLEESLAIYQSLGDQQGIAVVRVNQIQLARAQGQVQQVQHYYTEALAISRAQGNETLTAFILTEWGQNHLAQGAYAEAITLLEESRDLCLRLKNRHRWAYTLLHLGWAQVGQGEYRQAMQNCQAALEVMCALQDSRGMAGCLERLGDCLARLEEGPRAIYLLGFASALRRAQGVYLEARDAAAQIALLLRLRAQVGEEEFETTWLAGEHASLAAVLTVVQDLDPSLLSRRGE